MRTSQLLLVVALLGAVAVTTVSAVGQNKDEQKEGAPGKRKDGGGGGKGGGAGGGRGKGQGEKRGYNPDGSKMTKEERSAEKEKWRADKDARKGARTAKFLDKEGKKVSQEERKKAHAIFAAVVDPVTPKSVTIPLSDEDAMSYEAAKDALFQYALSKVPDYDLTKDEVKKDLREKITKNQAKAEEMMMAAVKSGMSLQQARTGMAIAQLTTIGGKFAEDSLKKTRERAEHMPEGAKEKQKSRAEQRHKDELDKIRELKSDDDKANWVKSHFKATRIPKLLE